MLPGRVNLITLGVADVAASTAFYKRLGWRRSETASTPDISFLALDNLVLGLYGRKALAAESNRPHAPAGPESFALAINLESEAAVDDAFALAVKAGARVLAPAKKMHWGGYSGYFADPDGHAWEIAHNPFFPLTHEGFVTLPE
ncbi:MAG: VOC family protein [Hyphomicrobiales bacterium]|nr:VOC family protein [Hyphomicrobiales bacterium]